MSRGVRCRIPNGMRHARSREGTLLRVICDVPQADRPPARRLRRGRASHVATLPGRLDRSWVVVLTHVGDCVARRHAVQDRQARQCGAGPATAAAACDFHPLIGGARHESRSASWASWASRRSLGSRKSGQRTHRDSHGTGSGRGRTEATKLRDPPHTRCSRSTTYRRRFDPSGSVPLDDRQRQLTRRLKLGR